MSNLRIIELEQQLKRRDERLQVIEAKIRGLPIYFIKEHVSGITYMCGNYFVIEDVLNCLK